MTQPRLILASASPRRRELLALAGFRFEVLAMDVPEQQQPDEAPAQYGQRVALAKAQAGFEAQGRPDDLVVLGADTEVALSDEVLGKPQDAHDAARMLRLLSGVEHRVLSAVAVVARTGSQTLVQVSRVRFKTLSEAEIADYLASGEAFGKAGAYAIQGRAAAFISHLEGSYTGVMGLPLFETCELLGRFGVLKSTHQPTGRGGRSVIALAGGL